MQQEEIKKTMDILRSAIQMEIDGKEFYLEAGEKSSNKLARELFQRLASEEDDHRRKFEEIHEALKKGQDWPAVEPPSDERAHHLALLDSYEYLTDRQDGLL